MEQPKKTTIQQVIDALKQKGYADVDVQEVTKQISRAATEQFTLRAMAVLTDEDLTAIDAFPEDAQASVEMQKRYNLRTGKDANTVMQTLLEQNAKDFLAQLATSIPAQSK